MSRQALFWDGPRFLISPRGLPLPGRGPGGWTAQRSPEALGRGVLGSPLGLGGVLDSSGSEKWPVHLQQQGWTWRWSY